MVGRWAAPFSASAKLGTRGAEETAALEESLAKHLASAHAAWPKIAMDDDLFVEHLALHAAAQTSALAFLGAVHAVDLYLACAVGHRDRFALAAFEEQLMARVPSYILRVRVAPDAALEITQKLRERLVMGSADGDARPKIFDYSGKGALGGWIRVAAVRTALNHVRGTRPPTVELDDGMVATGDPELAFVQERAKGLLHDAFRRVVEGLDANDRTILRLHYLEGMTMDQLATLYRTPRSTIARRVAAARTRILDETASRLRDEQRLSPSAVASVLRQARSRLDLTITHLLRS